jgi:hypothetical protein
VPSPPVFGADVDFHIVQRLKNQWFADRFWTQGNVTLTAEAQCGLDGQATCQRLSDAVARSFARFLVEHSVTVAVQRPELAERSTRAGSPGQSVSVRDNQTVHARPSCAGLSESRSVLGSLVLRREGRGC